jgi:hypothetical protein
MPRSTRALSLLLAGALSLGAAGCGNFQDVTTVVDLRVLAIRADPPEILIDPTSLTDLSRLPESFSTTVTALIADPAGGDRPITVDALACPRQIDAVTAATGKNGIVCKDPQSSDPDRSVSVTPPPPDSPLAVRTPFGDAQLEIPSMLPRELLERAYMIDPSAKLGFQLPIAFQLAVAAGPESEIAIKRVIFTVPPPDHAEQPANANPRITGLTTYAQRDDRAMAKAQGIDPQPFDPDHPPTVPLGGSLWFEPQGADTEAESYFARALTREATPQVVVSEFKETLRYAFFTTAGTFSPPSTNTVPPTIRTRPDHIHLESKYQAPTVMPADPSVVFWIVVRDERGGASWMKGRFLLAAP